MYTLTSMPFMLSLDYPKLVSLHGPLPSALPYQTPLPFVYLTCRPPVHLPAFSPALAHSIMPISSLSHSEVTFIHLQLPEGDFLREIFPRTTNILHPPHLFQSLMWQTCLTAHSQDLPKQLTCKTYIISKSRLWFWSNVVGHPQPT